MIKERKGEGVSGIEGEREREKEGVEKKEMERGKQGEKKLTI